MLSQEKLLKVIANDMQACRQANPTDHHGQQQQILEMATLTRHLDWAQSAGSNQAELEKIVQSLEKNMVVRYQQWRELSTV